MCDMNTFGGILIKCDTRNGKGLEKEFRDFLLELSTAINNRTEGDGPLECCHLCKCQAGDVTCDKMRILSCSSLTGFFDFFITLKSSDIETLEQFVVICLKGGAKMDLVAETQTLAGGIFFQNVITPQPLG